MGKFLTFILCIVAFAWCGVFGVNMQNAKALKEPIVLQVEGEIQKDGGTATYGGLGYDYYVKKEVLEDGTIAITQTKMVFVGHIIGEAVGENIIFSANAEVEETPEVETSSREETFDVVTEATPLEEAAEQGEAENVPEVVEMTVNLYYPDDQLMDMQIISVPIDLTKPQDLVDAWLAEGGISHDIQVISFADGKMDLNQAFADFICQFGSSGELMYMEGFTKTIKECYGLSELYLTIEGNVLETGHSIYDFAL